jgi:hypothetical protein
MSLSSLVLAMALSQASCDGERVALVPFEPIALSRAEARRLEDSVRRALEETPGVCVEPRASTVEKLRAQGGRLPACTEAVCRGAQVTAFGVDRLLRGVTLGVGGGRSVALTLVDREGTEARTSFQRSGLEAPPGAADTQALETFTALWGSRPNPRLEKRPGRVWPHVVLAAGGVALATGVGFGLAARQTETKLSEGKTGCKGEGTAFRDCFAEQLKTGQRQARTANVLMGAGAVLGAGGALFLFWEVP